ncbi:hypothetical protein [Acidovorax sp. SDU_ACID1]|uniref:hypothetical protein n=1 Tax=Acidovorax sp. SDU_ACID1 TaxID=3136632 RepID=UPI003872C66A
MALTMAAQARTSFDLKSASLPVVAVVLKTSDAAIDFAALVAVRGGSPAQMPVLLFALSGSLMISRIRLPKF